MQTERGIDLASALQQVTQVFGPVVILTASVEDQREPSAAA